MTAAQTTQALKDDWLRFARHYLTSRWVVVAVGALALAFAAYLNWGWLVAAGIAPILISLAPCAIMCGLGLCGMKMMGGSCEKQPASSGNLASAATPSSVTAASTIENQIAGSTCCHTHGGETERHKRTQGQSNERSEYHA